MIELLAQLGVLVFVVGSMASMGLRLSVEEIRAPLANLRIVAVALILSFVLAPLLGLGLAALFGLEEALSTGLVLISCAAGAPFLPKLVQIAKADVAAGVGLMVLLMVATVLVLPLLLPFLLAGVVVDSWAIARSLVLLMLLPLGLALAARARYGEATRPVEAALSQASSFALVLLMVLLVIVNFEDMMRLVGSRGLIAGLVFTAAVAAAGYLAGGPVMSLATGQRNISAAVLVAGQNFGLDVLTYISVVSLVAFAVLFPLAGELGRRSAGKKTVPPTDG